MSITHPIKFQNLSHAHDTASMAHFPTKKMTTNIIPPTRILRNELIDYILSHFAQRLQAWVAPRSVFQAAQR